VLAIHFDWGPQSQAVVDNIRFSGDDKARSRALLVDSRGLILAASDCKGVLSEIVDLDSARAPAGYAERASGELVAFHRTPGYETYRGLGWYGVIIQKPA
jgi:hypothetical protein